MITIQENINTALVYANTLDSGAEGLLRALCRSPLSAGSNIRIMPDVHAGKGCAVGTTMTLSDRVAPGLVGVDIGCGMEVYRVTCKRMELQRLDKLVQDNVPAGRAIRSKTHRFAEETELARLLCAKHIQQNKALRSIGTLGGGNHFIELDKGGDGSYYLIVHSGSRHLGVEIAEHYQKRAFAESPEGTPYELAWLEGDSMREYLHDMEIAQHFAALNRQAIADELIRNMKMDVLERFSTIHNYIDTEHMILRKGAVSAQSGEKLIIPMNMRDGCLLCVGKGNTDWNCSAPHGAGRLSSRADTLQSYTLNQYKKEMKGIYSSSIRRDTLDECPMAYKPVEEITRLIFPTVDILERIMPLYNFKAGAE